MTSVEHKPNGAELVHWAPWAEAFPWNTRLGQVLDTMRHTVHPGEFAPGGDLEETDDAFVLELDLPGIAKENVTIDVTGRRITVNGTRTEKERTGTLRHTTRATGSFSYEVTLPAAVDEKGVTASLVDGVLTVRMTKASGAKTTRIAIR
jgi:HSP20 family protein